MLLRYFVNFYDMEIIEEEAFLAWKEDITQEFPGKGKALFQVPKRRHAVTRTLKAWDRLRESKVTVYLVSSTPHPPTPPQVNQWLTWLETAEEEESDDEAD